jgi:hypothetical protein
MAVCAGTAGIDMTQDEIIEMAVKAGMAKEIAEVNIDIVEAFAKLAAAKEREACIEVCRKTITSQRSAWGANFCIEAIRARGQA